MIKKSFSFMLQFLAVILALICVMSFCGELRPIESIAEESAYEEELKYPITETDIHNGIDIADYAKYYGETIDINDDQITTYYIVHGDDAIVNFIPRELFKTVGRTFYVGREYGFLVDTMDLKSWDGVSPRFGAVHSIVMLFNITNKDELIENTTHFQSEVEVVFEGQFCYLPQGKQTKWIDTVAHYKDFEDSAKYTDHQYVSTDPKDENLQFAADCPDQSDYIIPIPTRLTYSYSHGSNEVCFRQCNKYYLQAPICNVNLYNEYHKNPGDSGYNAVDDEGMYFTQMDISYKGQYIEEKNLELKSLGKLGGECLLFLAQQAVETALDACNLGTLFDFLTAVTDKSGALYELTDMLQSAAGYKKVQGDEKFLTYHPFYDSKALQLEYYGGLQKEALFIASEYTEGKKMLLGSGNFIMADFSIHVPDEFWKTRYRLTWGLQAVHFKQFSEEVDVITAENPGYVDEIKVGGHKEDVDTLSEGNNSGYLLSKDTVQPFTFMPARNGNYEIQTSCNTQSGYKVANDKEIVVKDESGTIIGSSEKSQELHLDSLDVNRRYFFEVKCFNESESVGEYEITIEFAPEKAVIGSNKERSVRAFENEYFSFMPAESGIYTLKLNAPNKNITVRVDNIEEGTTEKNGEW